MKLVAKYGYPIGTKLMGADEMLFINWAYEEDPPMGLPLSAADEPDRYYIQLYHTVGTQVDLEGKKVLEVSCGHGGGSSYLVRSQHPASYTGLDLNPAGIRFCRKRHRLPGLDFVQGDAENLPFPDESFDVVLNVEASHHYPHFSKFLTEVARVLRPGGHFLYTDLRAQHVIPEWEAALDAAPLRKVSQRSIDDEVKRGLEKNSPRLQELIDRRVPKFLRGFARSNAGVEGGRLYRGVELGLFSYRVYDFVKD
ncbi:phthiotriol/phenolphthiotriol dimycocerosates methyltransferase [Mycobacterium sp. 050134]|uniref:phthiotriol/phenolphthiotriol dimycocerosates methyltransferase n=1 Tax=Mycobacterium sp. 050134 TaxID=3096111 RepID=UPI002ED80DD6